MIHLTFSKDFVGKFAKGICGRIFKKKNKVFRDISETLHVILIGISWEIPE